MHSDFVCRKKISFLLEIEKKIHLPEDIEPAKRGRKSSDVKNGTKTLRFKADGQATIEDTDDKMDRVIDRINNLLETYMGINDCDLGQLISEMKFSFAFCFLSVAQRIWDLAENQNNPSDFASAIDESDLGEFHFSDDFIFDIWAAIDDIKCGRIAEEEELESDRL